ncbi:MAG: HAD family phosphatase [Ruminococcus sp.]|nr:HAD family phosphatase [Ruminococcus sp.]
MPSIIFFDIDGTLITEDDRMLIPDSTREAIAETRRRGNYTFINTGRTAFNISKEVLALGFDGMLCGCGTYIEIAGSVELYHTQEQSLCRKIARILRECRCTPVYERREGYFFDDLAEYDPELDWFREHFVKPGIPMDRQVDDPDFGYDKFVFWANEHTDMARIRREIGEYYDIIDRGNRFFENVPRGYSKATAIGYVLKKLAIPLENAYAIGDSMNDLPMLQAVPNSIAMGGAEHIYPYVSYITTPIEEDGIANALRHFGLI